MFKVAWRAENAIAIFALKEPVRAIIKSSRFRFIVFNMQLNHRAEIILLCNPFMLIVNTVTEEKKNFASACTEITNRQ